VKNIRQTRPKPGLQRQHLACVLAAQEICQAALDGAELGSSEVLFHPGKVSGGHYQFAIGTAGSTTLLLQTILLPLLLRATQPSTVNVSGGTHNSLAPTADYTAKCFLPLLAKMGASIHFSLLRHGFMPAGGGVIRAEITPCAALQPLHLRERAAQLEISATVVVSQLSEQIVKRVHMALESGLSALGAIQAQTRLVTDAACAGIVCWAGALDATNGLCELSTAYGQMGRTAENLGSSAARGILRYLQSQVPVGPHLADQLMLPLAMAGAGSLISLPGDSHFQTNNSVIQAFLGRSFRTQDLGRGQVLSEWE
jgi:RNA 3'-terminal phosphate cyclase (ATP)